jgi:type II secretory pathway pseudopilin PulG
MKKNIPNTNPGFTLIELLITIFFVSVGLIGVIVFFNASLESQFDAKNEIIAAGLAQEGAELVRNLVEYKKMGEKKDWATIVSELQGNVQKIDYDSLVSHNFRGTSYNYYICFSGGRYQQCDSGNGIGMQRYLDISCVNINGSSIPCPSAVGLSIIATVKWDNDSRVTTATDIIYKNEY